MASFESLLQAGQIKEALTTLQADIRRDASNVKLRVALFQLCCVLGDWGKAMNQLEICSQFDSSTLAMQQTYRELILCERLRECVFRGQKVPMIFGEPQAWLARLIEALLQECKGETALAQSLRAQALEEAPATSVQAAQGTQSAWIADADSRLGPVLEAVVNGKYFWVPFSSLRSLKLEKPSDLRDLVWIPAHLEFSNGGEAVAFIPTRYVFTPEANEPPLLLSRMTRWSDQGNDTYFGLGQRMFATEADDIPLLEAGELHFSTDGFSDAPDSCIPGVL
jgi:type VI secretion system protein ImpE